MVGGAPSSEVAGISPLQLQLDTLKKSVGGMGEGNGKVTFFEKDDKVGYGRTVEIPGVNPSEMRLMGVAAEIGGTGENSSIVLGENGRFYAISDGRMQIEVPSEEIVKILSGKDTTPISDGKIRVDENLTAHVGS